MTREEASSKDAGGTDKMGKDNRFSRAVTDGFLRAVTDDDTALFLSAVESFRNVARGRLPKGSEASRILGQEMFTRLLHLACRHDAVECARLLLDGGHGITATLVDARDQLMQTPLHIAAGMHSARCIQLLLSRNARTDLRVVDEGPLVALEVALMSRRVQIDWSPESSVKDLLAYLRQKDLNAVRLLAEKTREVGEVAYRYAMEGRVPQLAMLLLVAEDKISATVSVVIDGVRTKRSIYNSLVDEVLSIGDASARVGNERRKALLCVIELLNQFGALSWTDPNISAAKAGDTSVTNMLPMGDADVNETHPKGNTALHSCLSSSSSRQEPTKQRPVDVAASQHTLKSANVASVNDDFLEMNNTKKRKRCKEVPSDDFNDSYDDFQTSYTMPKSHSAPKVCLRPVHGAAAKRNCEVHQGLSTLYVSSPVGRLTFRIALSETVLSLRYMVAKRIGCLALPERIAIRFGCKVLANDKQLCFYGLSDNCVVDMYVRFLGGQPPAAKKQKVAPRMKYNVTLDEFADPDKACSLPALVVTKRIPSHVEEDKMEDSNELSVTGRRIGKGLVAKFMMAKDARQTWGGEIELTDFRINNGQVRLLKAPRLPQNGEVWKEEWVKDCKAEARIFRAIFMKVGRETPPYLEYLIDLLENPETKWGWSDWFSRFQVRNLAFKPSHRRLHASQDIWGYFQKLKPQKKRDDFMKIMENVKIPEAWLGYEGIENSSIFGPTFRNYKKKNKVYPRTALGCLLFSRNYGTHGKFLHWLMTEIAIPKAFKGFMSQLIKELLENGHDVDEALDDE